MKKILMALVVTCFAAASFATPDAVLESFSSNFPDAKNVSWSEDRDLYMVYFKKENVQYRLWFNENGVVEKSFRYYAKDKLPSFVRTRIEAKHEGKDVMGVVETTDQHHGLRYIIAMQDETHWYEAEIFSNGQMSLKKKFRKL